MEEGGNKMAWRILRAGSLSSYERFELELIRREIERVGVSTIIGTTWNSFVEDMG